MTRTVQGVFTSAKISANDAAVNRFTLSQYFEAMRYYKGATLVIIVGFSITTICLSALLPFVLAHAIDLVSQHQPVKWGSKLTDTLLWALGIVIVGAASDAVGFRGFVQLDSPAQNYLRSKVLHRLTHESASFYADTMSGSLTGNVIAFTNGYATVQEVLFQRGISLVMPLIVGTIIVAVQSLLLAGIFVLIACCVGFKTLVDSRKRAPFRQARKETGSQLNGFVGDIISNSATVRTFANETHEKHGLLRHQLAWRIAAQTNLSVFAKHFVSLVGGINILQVGGIGLAAWLATTGKISLGLVVFAISYFQRLSSGLLELGPLVQNYQGALIDAAPISEILMSQQTVTDSASAKKLMVSRGAIQLKAVTYRYEKDVAPVFNNLTLDIAAGQSVGIVGRSGGGKTTLTNLLLRFADLESGSISIDGQDISKVTQRSLRSAVSYVPQDSQLFHRSIRENIAYGKPRASKKAVMAAAKKAHIWELIQGMPEGLETKVGERGVKLSGGQRQRVAIARAILKDAPILIFDEATSALDSESEQYIQASLRELMKGRTAIVVAHRLSTIQKMDRIIVLDHGRIAEDGSHAELIKQKGLYATLWAHQSGGFIEE